MCHSEASGENMVGTSDARIQNTVWTKVLERWYICYLTVSFVIYYFGQEVLKGGEVRKREKKESGEERRRDNDNHNFEDKVMSIKDKKV